MQHLAINDRSITEIKGQFSAGHLPQFSERITAQFSCIHCGNHIMYGTAAEHLYDNGDYKDYYIRELRERYNSLIRLIYTEYELSPEKLRDLINIEARKKSEFHKFVDWELYLASLVFDVKVPSVFELECPHCNKRGEYPFDTSKYHIVGQGDIIREKADKCLKEFNNFTNFIITNIIQYPDFKSNVQRVTELYLLLREEFKRSRKQ